MSIYCGTLTHISKHSKIISKKKK